MARKIVPMQVGDFSGGWNLAADQFNLADNEVPEIFNMMLQQDGSLRVRKGWEAWGEAGIAAFYEGRNHFFHSSTNVRQLLVAKSWNADVAYGNGGAWTEMGIDATATPHVADFATWLDRCYIACGVGNPSIVWDGTTDTALTASGAGQWQDDYDAPVTTHMPEAEFVQRHADRLWVAYTNEDTDDYPLRIRYSHFNQPGSWAESDYIDLPAGGGQITGLQAFKDTLLVFKERQVFAIYGYDPEQYNPVELTAALGIPNRNCVSANEQRCYFYDIREGVWSWDGRKFTDHFEKLRVAIDEGWITNSEADRITVDCYDRQVWVALPYLRTGSASQIYATFVYDETIGKFGAWTQVFSVGGLGVRSITAFVDSDGTKIPLARGGSNWIVQLDARDDARDNMGGAIAEDVFSCGFATRWLDPGVWGQKGSWRAPEYIFSDQDADSTIIVNVYHDYDEITIQRQHSVTQTAESGTALEWDVSDWDEAYWGTRRAGSVIVRGSPLGTARAVKLLIYGSFYQEGDGVPWGLNGIVFKVTPRKIR